MFFGNKNKEKKTEIIDAFKWETINKKNCLYFFDTIIGYVEEDIKGFGVYVGSFEESSFYPFFTRENTCGSEWSAKQVLYGCIVKKLFQE